MVDPSGGLVTGLLSQVLGELASDLLESLARTPRGAGVVEDPIRMERRRPDPLRPRRLGAAELDRLVAGLADRLAGMQRRADNTLPEHEWVAALAAVRDTLARSAPLDAALVVTAARLDPERLESLVRRAGADVPRNAALSAGAEAVYDEMLQVGCPHVVEFITARREFTVWASRQTVQQTGEILDQVNRLQTSLASDVIRAGATLEQSARDEADLAFTRRYAGFVVSRLDALEVVGVSLRQTPRRYALDAAYTNLSAARAATPDSRQVDSQGLTGSGIPVTDILPTSARAVLRGVAGSGKTTTVQWLAVGAARELLAAGDPEPRTATASVPFVIPLRRFVSRGLPAPEGFLSELARPLAHAAPSGWVDRMLLSGRALVLVDGVDEVPSQSLGDGAPARTLRSDVETWLGELVAAYPGPDSSSPAGSRPFPRSGWANWVSTPSTCCRWGRMASAT
jgi:NACHT domain